MMVTERRRSNDGRRISGIIFDRDADALIIPGRRYDGSELPVRSWDGARRAWIVPHVLENWYALRQLRASLDDIPAPTRTFARVESYRKSLALFIPFSAQNTNLCRAFPDRRVWKPAFKGTGAWLVAATRVNIEHLLRHWPKIRWSTEAAAVRDSALSVAERAVELSGRKTEEIPDTVGDYEFGGTFKPYAHQRKAFLLSRDQPAYALFMDPGTGKTRVVIDNACWLHGKGELSAVLVVCPNGVKDVWAEEIALHSPKHYRHEAIVFSAAATKAERARTEAHAAAGRIPGKLAWLIVNVEAASTASSRGLALMRRFIAEHGPSNLMLVVDESSKIKSPQANRTKTIIQLGKGVAWKRVLTGTPSTQGPLDLYAQFQFLDPKILGFGSYYSFRNRYASVSTAGGFPQVLGYRHVDELRRLIDPFSYRVTRDECLDLPDKIYLRRTVKLNSAQRRLYDQLRHEMRAEFEDREITVVNALSQLLRLQQVVGGFVPPPERDALDVVLGERPEPGAIPGRNPKLAAVGEILAELPETDKVVIWARFRPEIDLLCRELRREYGAGSVVEFHGGINREDRAMARRLFQDPRSYARFFVGQTETGGIGITLTAARVVIYYSNSFSLESRIQSEDRCHRIGQHRAVTYFDLTARDTIDLRLLTTLRKKKRLADEITGDAWKEWI